jgi:hypothetical protein
VDNDEMLNYGFGLEKGYIGEKLQSEVMKYHKNSI